MSIELFLDIAIVALLIPTLIFAVILNSRLASLRRNRDDLARLISRFNEATVRAESGIPRLRKAAEDAGEKLQDRVEKAQALRDDLAFMIERGDSMANRLEAAVRAARDEAKPSPLGMETAAGAPPKAANAASAPGGTLGALIADETASLAGRGAREDRGAHADAGDREGRDREGRDRDGDFMAEDERSEAERELLRALQRAR